MKKIKEYDILRVLAVLLVIISHCTYYQIITNYGGIDYQKFGGVANSAFFDQVTIKILKLFTRILYSFHMPLFFYAEWSVI